MENATIDHILKVKASLPGMVYARHLEQRPELKSGYSELMEYHYKQDIAYLLNYLAEAVRLDEPQLFLEFMRWCKVFFSSIRLPHQEVAESFLFLQEVITTGVDHQVADTLNNLLTRGIREFDEYQLHTPKQSGDNYLQKTTDEYLAFLLKGDKASAAALTMNLYKAGVPLQDIYSYVFQPAQVQLGHLWQTNKITVAQEHFVSAATQSIMSQFYPFLFSGNKKNKNIVIACVAGELHEIGARMIADFFEMSGWNSYYLGASTPTASTVSAVEGYNAQILAISVTMTPNIPVAEQLIKAVKDNPATVHVKVVVGGYPFNIAPALHKKIGADMVAGNARKAVELIGALQGV